jgi:hypothetical protein
MQVQFLHAIDYFYQTILQSIIVLPPASKKYYLHSGLKGLRVSLDCQFD